MIEVFGDFTSVCFLYTLFCISVAIPIQNIFCSWVSNLDHCHDML